MSTWQPGDVVRLDDGSVWGRFLMVTPRDPWVCLSLLASDWDRQDDTYIGTRSPTLIARGGQPVPTWTGPQA